MLSGTATRRHSGNRSSRKVGAEGMEHMLFKYKLGGEALVS
jgi:hypothetical protein